jgi:sugar/nucleoside kinase (ribokinase family)
VTAPPPTVLVAGHVTLDRYADEELPGGAAYYAGLAYHGLGAIVHVATAFGPEFPRAALAPVEVDAAASDRTTRFVNSYGPDGRRTQHVGAAAPPLDPGRLPAAWAQPDVLHLAPVVAEVDLARWVAWARGRFVGIGVQGWVRAVAPDGTVEQPRWEIDRGALAGVHAAAVGEDDLRGQGDLLARLADAVPVVAFTHGAKGCELLVRGRTVRVGAFRTAEVDPTGAGDVFAAGLFLALAAGEAPADAARLGAAAASIVVEGRAGAALPRIAEARRRVPAIEGDT